MSVKCKTFDLYIKELIYHPRRAPKWLSDKRLTSQEKKIIQGYLLIRTNQSEKVIRDLESLQESEIDFVCDHWNLLLGICYNNIGEHSRGEEYLRTAIAGFEEKKTDYHLFTAFFNLFMLLSNTGKIQEMGDVLKRMEEINPSEKLAKVRLLRCQFIYACDSNNNDEARELIKKINKMKEKFSESDIAQHLVCEFMFYIKQEELHKAEETLWEMKNHRNYSSSENFIFMKKLLSHLKEDTALYVYEREFSSTSFLFYQMKVIESLQSKDETEAKKFWSKLQEKYPHLYQDDLKYLGEKCLFSLCLDKHLVKENTLNLQIISGDGALHKRLYQILQDAGSPVSKGLLYELVWGDFPESKDDFLKLAKLVSKVRNIYKVEIVSRKGTYLIEKERAVLSKR